MFVSQKWRLQTKVSVVSKHWDATSANRRSEVPRAKSNWPRRDGGDIGKSEMCIFYKGVEATEMVI